MKRMFMYLLGFYGVVGIALFLFSYTQVDLSLTLSQSSIIQTIEKAFQHIGYYQRPLATAIYCSILLGLCVGYGAALSAAQKKQIAPRQFWIIVAILSGILLFSYPAALSYDIFNYVFTAKTVLVYKLNPYELIPLQMQGIDPMLSFMRWTHLASAYTPLWIALTLPAYLISFGSLLLALWMMKGLTLIFYVLCIVLIGKVMESIAPKKALVSMILFALNPLVIIEVLLDAHNDIAMMAFALLAFYLAQKKQRVSSFFALSLSVATKLITGALVPLGIVGWNRVTALLLMSVALAAVLFRREFLPWYFLWVLPFAALFPEKRFIFLLTLGISIGLLLRYAPVLYFGDYNSPVPQLELWGTIVPIGISILLIGISSLVPLVVRNGNKNKN